MSIFRFVIFTVCIVLSSFIFFSCGDDTEGEGEPVTISGSLVSSASRASLDDRAALFGYQLYCVTFANPPIAGSGTADSSGAVSVTLAAKNVAIGCFVLNTAGVQVATLAISSSGSSSNMFSPSASTELGNISVHESSGNATATLSASTATLVTTTPTAVSCPVGVFESSEFDAPSGGSCEGLTSKFRFFFTQDADGTLRGSYIVANNWDSEAACKDATDNASTVTYSNNAVTLVFTEGETEGTGCTSSSTYEVTYVFPVNSSCTSISLDSTATESYSGCLNCDGDAGDNSGCQGCGRATCTGNFSILNTTATKQ